MKESFDFNDWYDRFVAIPEPEKQSVKKWLKSTKQTSITSLLALTPDMMPDTFPDGNTFSASNKTLLEAAAQFTLRASNSPSGNEKKMFNSSSSAKFSSEGSKMGLDKTVAPASPQSSLSVEEAVRRAGELKEAGNAAFKNQKFADALGFYKEGVCALQGGVEASPEAKSLLASLYSNKAQVYLKTEDWDSAINCATVVLQYEPCNVKATFRRSVAYARSNKLEDARNELTRVLELDPANVAARRELAEVSRALRESRTREKSAFSGIFSRGSMYEDKEQERLERVKREQEQLAADTEALARSNAQRAERGLPEQTLQQWRRDELAAAQGEEEEDYSGSESEYWSECSSDDDNMQLRTTMNSVGAGKKIGGTKTAGNGGRDKEKAKSSVPLPRGLKAQDFSGDAASRSLEEFFQMAPGQHVDSISLLESLQQAQGTKSKGTKKSPQSLSSSKSGKTSKTKTRKSGEAVPPSTGILPGSVDVVDSFSNVLKASSGSPLCSLPPVDATSPLELSKCLKHVKSGVSDIRSAECMESLDAHLSTVVCNITRVLRMDRTQVMAPFAGPAEKGSGKQKERQKEKEKGKDTTDLLYNYNLECEFEMSLRPMLACIGNERQRGSANEVAFVPMRSIIESGAGGVTGTGTGTGSGTEKGPETDVNVTKEGIPDTLSGAVHTYRGTLFMMTDLLSACQCDHPDFAPINSRVGCSKVTKQLSVDITNPQVAARIREALALMQRKVVNKLIEFDHLCRLSTGT